MAAMKASGADAVILTGAPPETPGFEWEPVGSTGLYLAILGHRYGR